MLLAQSWMAERRFVGTNLSSVSVPETYGGLSVWAAPLNEPFLVLTHPWSSSGHIKTQCYSTSTRVGKSNTNFSIPELDVFHCELDLTVLETLIFSFTHSKYRVCPQLSEKGWTERFFQPLSRLPQVIWQSLIHRWRFSIFDRVNGLSHWSGNRKRKWSLFTMAEGMRARANAVVWCRAAVRVGQSYSHNLVQWIQTRLLDIPSFQSLIHLLLWINVIQYF